MARFFSFSLPTRKCCLLYRKQCDLSIFMPLQQSVCRPYLPIDCRTESNNTFSNLPNLAFLHRNAYFLLVGANLSPRLISSLLLQIQPKDCTFYKIQSVLNIVMTVDSLFLPNAALLFIYLLLKPLLSKLLTSPSANKKNLSTVKHCALMTPSLWSFSSQSRLDRLLPINSHSFSCALHFDGSS